MMPRTEDGEPLVLTHVRSRIGSNRFREAHLHAVHYVDEFVKRPGVKGVFNG